MDRRVLHSLNLQQGPCQYTVPGCLPIFIVVRRHADTGESDFACLVKCRFLMIIVIVTVLCAIGRCSIFPTPALKADATWQSGICAAGSHAR